MTPSDFGRALNAAVLEVMPERKCSGCGKALPMATHSEALPFEDKGGLVVLFWCEACGAKPKAEECEDSPDCGWHNGGPCNPCKRKAVTR